ncbi:MAG: 3-deoxy-7-phosphoheptulonate synthase [Lentisphaerae bacterium]|jgi:3-deoxy-7-phosphoheptulonate synthase|nr:3-deoxy-7-phosphoheptulonate synthase [Lentisphaerota bacterium]
MKIPTLENINIKSVTALISPKELRAKFPQTDTTVKTIQDGRSTIENIIDGKEKRLLAIVGPCSIHNVNDANEYAKRLKKVAEAVSDSLFVVMRVYFEKPRSVRGWKGFINDPFLDDTFKMEEGLSMARSLLLNFAEMGLATATEILDPLTPQYIGDLVSWSAIGARTSESQTHREIASGMSTPIGFKNATDGSLDAAINGIKSASGEHHFLGVTYDGLPAVFSTSGNRHAHVVLRGGRRPNYDAVSIAECEEALEKAGLPLRIVVDCSHGNSRKDAGREPIVLRDIILQIENGNKSICGFMLESFLESGNQAIPSDISRLQPGMSITDACIDWDTTEELLLEAARRLKPVIQER